MECQTRSRIIEILKGIKVFDVCLTLLIAALGPEGICFLHKLIKQFLALLGRYGTFALEALAGIPLLLLSQGIRGPRPFQRCKTRGPIALIRE